jgi:recombination protein RecT
MNNNNQPAPGQQQTAVAPTSVSKMLANPNIQSRFNEILKDKAPAFISSIINLVNGNQGLSVADPQSIIMSAAVAATLDLPINPNLGFAYIIAYKQKYTDNNGKWGERSVAQFQMGYKGFIQLAMRTGQYKHINALEIRAGQLKKANPLTEEYEFDFSVEGGEVIGYVAYFKMLNGFEKTVYWNVAKIIDHAKRYSKSYGQKSSPWTTNFPEMALKTLIKHVLSKYGILSIEMQKAVNVDQSVIKDDKSETFEYVDATDLTGQQSIAASNEQTATTAAQPTNEQNADTIQPVAGANINVNDL